MSSSVRLQAAVTGRYTVLEEIGHGGMATVFLARDLRHERDVAIKVLNSELAASIGAERFSREIRIAATLQHPNILPLYDSGSEGDLLYYVMPFVAGASLRSRLQHEKQLPVPEAIRITRQIAEGLEYAHSRGVIHRDVKPENILLSGDQVFVADFGVARAVRTADDGAPITSTGVTVGTPQYMSPEQATAEAHLDARSDVYALGCVFYEMLAGEPPFTGPSMAAIVARHLQAPVPDISIVRPAISPGLVDALSTALAKTPADRFPSAAAFSAALGQELTTPRRASRAVRVPARRFWSPARMGMALAGVAVAAAAMWFGRGLLGGSDEGDPNLVLIAPFNVIDREGDLQIWREGVVDVVSRNLHGAGALRTVSPTLVVSRIRGTSDQSSVESAARALNAGLGIYGTLTRRGADSVRLLATTVRIGNAEPESSIDITGPADRMDQLCDSLTVKLLEALAAAGHEGVGRPASVRTTSITALKDFLRGEQLVRAALYDSAEYYFQRASELDTAFTLAYQRRYFVRLHQGDGGESPADYALALRAGQLNRGLSPRDSLLVAIDSMQAAIALRDYMTDSLGLALRQSAFRAVDLAASRFPGDAEVWFRMGMARSRLNEGDIPSAGILEPFDRAIELDSLFMPPYRYAIELSMMTSGHVEGRRHIEAYLRRNPRGVNGDGMRLALRLMNAEGRQPEEVDRWIAEAPAAVAFAAFQAVFWWPDSGETAIRVARRIAHDPIGRAELAPANDAWGRIVLSVAQSWRGRLSDAVATWGSADAMYDRFPALATQISALSGIPPAVLDRRLQRAPGSPGSLAAMRPDYLAAWGLRRDTVALRRVRALAELALGTARDTPGRERLRYFGDGAEAYLALAAGDSASAVRGLSTLNEDACSSCDFDRLTLAQLQARRGNVPAADSILRRDANRNTEPAGVLWRLERARAAQRHGDRNTAIREYRFVADVWRHADAPLQRYVEEARAALRTLGA